MQKHFTFRDRTHQKKGLFNLLEQEDCNKINLTICVSEGYPWLIMILK